jgi:hypothetical protein
MIHLAAVALFELAVVSASLAVVEFDGESYVDFF